MNKIIYMNSNGNYMCYEEDLKKAKIMGADFRYIEENNEDKLNKIIEILKEIRDNL